MMIGDRYLNRVQLIWIQNFLSSRPLAKSKLKGPVCLTLYPQQGKNS